MARNLDPHFYLKKKRSIHLDFPSKNYIHSLCDSGWRFRNLVLINSILKAFFPTVVNIKHDTSCYSFWLHQLTFLKKIWRQKNSTVNKIQRIKRNILFLRISVACKIWSKARNSACMMYLQRILRKATIIKLSTTNSLERKWNHGF